MISKKGPDNRIERGRALEGALFAFACVILLTALGGCTLLTDLDRVGRPICAEDTDCDDGVFCNGAELCMPEAEDANALGCVSPEPEDIGEDGVACTVARCDEEAQVFDQIPQGCECEGDRQCEAMAEAPCEKGVCDLATYTCAVVEREVAEPCDDGIACTTGTTCRANGACQHTNAQRDDTLCDDGRYCNGVELCRPNSNDADPITGCIAAASSIIDGAEGNDGIDCTVPFCDDETQTVTHDPSACACVTDEDCQRPGIETSCRVFVCDQDDFSCVEEGEVADETPCDDGAVCTVDDMCLAGECVGEAIDVACQGADPCVGVCQPASPEADATGCVRDSPVLPAPAECVE